MSSERIARAVRKILLADAPLDDAACDEDALAPIAAAASRGRDALGPERGRTPIRLGNPREELARIIDRRSTRYLGFSLHADVRVAGCNRERREKLIRYMARPAIASTRLRIARDSDVIYGFKRTWKDGSKAIKLSPMAFLERLAALVPRPRHPLVTYHGVLTPNSALRPAIVKVPEPEAPCEARKSAPGATPERRENKPRNRSPYYPWAELLQRVLARQTFLDADHHARLVELSAKDPTGSEAVQSALALDSLARSERPLLFVARSELQALRGASLASEFVRPMVLVGTGTEFRRLTALTDAGLPIVVLVAFPDAPDVSTLAAQEQHSLADLAAWEQAPTNLRRLSDAGPEIALTSARLESTSDFASNLAIAIEHGLTEDAALRALTATPAKLLASATDSAGSRRGTWPTSSSSRASPFSHM